MKGATRMWFFKEKLKGSEYADALIAGVSRAVYDSLDDILVQISQNLESMVDTYSVDQHKEFFATLLITAVITAELQVVKNIRGEYFQALRGHVFNNLGDVLGRHESEELYDLFMTEWSTAISRGEEPVTFGLGSVLYDAMDLPRSKYSDLGEYQSPLLLMVLGNAITSFVGFTKSALEKYKIKPNE